MRIQHNITALSAYRNLTNNNSMVAKNLEKLSSGYRINRAGDDAAGLAISEKMRAQITGLETAQKNANDGISLIQTAEGALTEVHSMLNRMVELANQSANGTYQDDDRVSLQSEVDALKEEIDRISKSTNFNGRTLLNGDLAIDGGSSATSSTKVTGADVFGTQAANVSVTPVKDGEIGKDKQKLKFTLDLSNVKIENNSTGNTVISGSDIKISIGGATISAGSGISITKGGSISGADLAKAIAEANADGITIANTSAGAVAPNVKFKVTAEGDKLVFEMEELPAEDYSSASLQATLSVDVTTSKALTNINQAEAITVKVDQEAVFSEGRKYAQGTIDITAVEDGYALKIGEETYVFAVGKDSKFKDVQNIEGLGKVNVIDLTAYEANDADLIKMAGVKLSQQDNSLFKIGTDYTANGIIGLTEKEGAFQDYKTWDLVGGTNSGSNNGTVDGSRKDALWGTVKNGALDISIVQAAVLDNPVTTETDAVAASGGLTLQIGDTSDAFNQMTVGIKSMSSASLGIGGIDVSTQAGAAAAVDKIKAAINTVSAQRGDLGALQNRLEHTINNLSVTTENITAAESRIRDVDMAKEMMAYTKNNILVQASQAMLAQANQIPQGVLQLLQ